MPMANNRSDVLYQHPLTHDQFRPLKLLLAGGMAGAVSRSVTAPIDRVKMLMQVTPLPPSPLSPH